jgi:hypothetical protein
MNDKKEERIKKTIIIVLYINITVYIHIIYNRKLLASSCPRKNNGLDLTKYNTIQYNTILTCTLD